MTSRPSQTFRHRMKSTFRRLARAEPPVLKDQICAASVSKQWLRKHTRRIRAASFYPLLSITKNDMTLLVPPREMERAEMFRLMQQGIEKHFGVSDRKDPSRILLPASLDNEERYDFVGPATGNGTCRNVPFDATGH